QRLRKARLRVRRRQRPLGDAGRFGPPHHREPCFSFPPTLPGPAPRPPPPPGLPGDFPLPPLVRRVPAKPKIPPLFFHSAGKRRTNGTFSTAANPSLVVGSSNSLRKRYSTATGNRFGSSL